MKLELDKEETVGIVELLLKLVEQKNSRATAISPKSERLDTIIKLTPLLKEMGYTHEQIVDLLRGW
jgi:hypothetical protein